MGRIEACGGGDWEGLGGGRGGGGSSSTSRSISAVRIAANTQQFCRQHIAELPLGVDADGWGWGAEEGHLSFSGVVSWRRRGCVCVCEGRIDEGGGGVGGRGQFGGLMGLAGSAALSQRAAN